MSLYTYKRNEDSGKGKWLFIIMITLFLLVLVCPGQLFPQENWQYRDSTYVDHALGTSGFTSEGEKTLLSMKAWLDDHPDYKVKEIFSGADSVLWIKRDKSLDLESFKKAAYLFYDTDTVMTEVDTLGRYEKIDPKLLEFEIEKQYESAEKSTALDGGVITTRNREVAKILGLHSFVSGYLTDNTRQTLIVLGKKENLSGQISDLKGNQLLLDLRVSSLEDQKRYVWSILFGWQGITFGDQRDLSVPEFGLRLSKDIFFIQVLDGINPWSEPGYMNYWYRDILATAQMGCIFYQTEKWKTSALFGGLVGWEFTSEDNRFAMQTLGVTFGLGNEFYLTENVSVVFSGNYVSAETSDITIETGKIRGGISGSCGMKIQF